MRRVLLELVGSFIISLTAVESVRLLGFGRFTPIAVAGVTIGLVYALRPLSIGFFNPAVTFALHWRRQLTFKEASMYSIAQCVGASLGPIVLAATSRRFTQIPLNPNVSQAILCEASLTLALVLCYFGTYSSNYAKDNQYFGIAIGAVILGAGVALGGVTGGVVNPALAIGFWLVGVIHPTDLWHYIASEFLGAYLAVLLFYIAVPEERILREATE